MTSKEFNEALKGFRNSQLPKVLYGRIFLACTMIIKHRRNIDDVRFTPTHDEVVDFLDGLDRERRRKLKQIVEGIDFEGTETLQ